MSVSFCVVHQVYSRPPPLSWSQQPTQSMCAGVEHVAPLVDDGAVAAAVHRHFAVAVELAADQLQRSVARATRWPRSVALSACSVRSMTTAGAFGDLGPLHREPGARRRERDARHPKIVIVRVADDVGNIEDRRIAALLAAAAAAARSGTPQPGSAAHPTSR